MSQIVFDTPRRPKPSTRPARRNVCTSEGGSPSEPRRHGHLVTRALPGPPATVPLLVAGTHGVHHRVREAKLLGKGLRQFGVHCDHAIHLAVPRDHELEPHPEATQRWVAGAQTRHPRNRSPQSEPVLELGGLQGEVVAEPLGLLVCIRVAPDVDHQRRVVDDRPGLFVEPHPIRHPQRDQALTQHVLHRLPEPEVDSERPRGHELGKANWLGARFAGHRRRLLGGPVPRKRAATTSEHRVLAGGDALEAPNDVEVTGSCALSPDALETPA